MLAQFAMGEPADSPFHCFRGSIQWMHAGIPSLFNSVNSGRARVSTAAGCWEKIEYTGDHSKTSSPSTTTSSPVAAGDKPTVPEVSVPDSATVSPPAPDATNATPITAAPASSTSTTIVNTDDRYGAPLTPRVASDAPPTPPKHVERPGPATSPAAKTAEDDRYGMTQNAAPHASDSPPSDTKPEIPSTPAGPTPAADCDEHPKTSQLAS